MSSFFFSVLFCTVVLCTVLVDKLLDHFLSHVGITLSGFQRQLGIGGPSHEKADRGDQSDHQHSEAQQKSAQLLFGKHSAEIVMK